MIKEMVVTATPLETKVAILENDEIAELYIERNLHRGILGNIYKGRVTKVLPGMQSSFVNVGLEKDAFLYVSDFIEDSEEYEKVISDAEEKVVDALEGVEETEKPARRPRRSRWRDRGRDRPLVKAAATFPTDPDIGERWSLGAETERETEAVVGPFSSIPAPSNLETHSSDPNSMDPAAVGEGVAHRESASLRDDGKVAPLAQEKSGPPTGATRRRGTGARHKRYTAARHRRTDQQSIGDMLQEGQEILVQVAKEPIAKKGARVTSHIALPGRYLVYMPTVDHVGVSRKIGSEAERMRLRDVILKQRPQFPGGVIIRTAAEGHSEEDIVSDLTYLVRLWEDIRSRSEKSTAPELIHGELNLVQRILRDQFSFEYTAIRVDDEEEYARVIEFVDKIYPNLVHRVKLYTKETDIFDDYGVNAEVDKLIQPKIWLKSGGYIVINQTEALVSIDINTGKFVGRGTSLEETITRTNIEAVKEIIRQLRLRDLGGIIVIDFIDMDERKNRKRVMEALFQEMSHDKAPSKILEFNEFGLVAITRKRTKQSLERTLCQPCNYCSGSGLVKSVATTCYNIYHEFEKMKDQVTNGGEIMIRVHPEVARAFRESASVVLGEIHRLVHSNVAVKSDSSLHIEHYNIVT